MLSQYKYKSMGKIMEIQEILLNTLQTFLSLNKVDIVEVKVLYYIPNGWANQINTLD